MRRTMLAGAGLLLALALTPGTATAAKKKPKLKIAGLSVNRWFMAPGGKAELDDGTNACYTMAGPAGTPPDITVFAFVSARNVPKSAPMTLDFETPWERQYPTEAFQGPFNRGLHKSKGKSQVAIFGGPAGKRDYFTYEMMPVGGPTSVFLSGDYKLKVTVKARGKTLTRRATVSVAC
jgi:hypothetical protein